MDFTNMLVEWLASRLKVPADALGMFKAASRLSGLDRKTLPSELIPLNTRQIARGVLNFTVLQSSPGWVLPFWAEKQYDPSDCAFVPRSHLGLSINITHRNWTAVGNPDCPVEPIVDPAGLVTPRPGGWSVDTWMKIGATVVFPSRYPRVRQRLVDDFPIVETAVEVDGVRLTTSAFSVGSQLVQEITVSSTSSREVKVEVCCAIRPFNPEGVSLVHDLSFEERDLYWRINRMQKVVVSRLPDSVSCRAYADGDSAALFAMDERPASPGSAHCPTGLANGFVSWKLNLKPRSQERLHWSTALTDSEVGSLRIPDRAQACSAWGERLREGGQVDTPDPELNRIIRASRGTLLMLADGPSITPGPATYHQFWFRDAAYMLLALNRLGHHRVCRCVVQSFPDYQDRAGYFRSQQGEWDSNGQAIWTVWQHVLLSGERDIAESQFDQLCRGVRWIERMTRGRNNGSVMGFDGLLPAGLSAEHLGLSDHYFWDNFWSLAGIYAFADISRRLGRNDEERYARSFAGKYRTTIDEAIDSVQSRFSLEEIPASPGRGIDHGMIGSCSALYPLQLISPDDRRMQATLRTLSRLYLRDGLFFQGFIHSGLNPYLTLHMAHAWLQVGERNRFWRMLSDVVNHASPTLNFPEAIHPITGGGSMGDGHHGWAAAEVLLAARDAFVYEQWTEDMCKRDLILLAGIPAEWFAPGMRFSFLNSPVPGGTISLNAASNRNSIELLIGLESSGEPEEGRLILKLPFGIERVRIDGRSARVGGRNGRRNWVELPAGGTSFPVVIEPGVRRWWVSS